MCGTAGHAFPAPQHSPQHAVQRQAHRRAVAQLVGEAIPLAETVSAALSRVEAALLGQSDALRVGGSGMGGGKGWAMRGEARQQHAWLAYERADSSSGSSQPSGTTTHSAAVPGPVGGKVALAERAVAAGGGVEAAGMVQLHALRADGARGESIETL